MTAFFMLGALASASLATFSIAVPVAGDDPVWPDYRGPGRDGCAPESASIPLEWSESENVAWKTPMGGRGWSSPVIAEGRVWLTTANPEGTELMAVAVDLASGEILREELVFEVEAPQECNSLNSYASPTPAIEAGRVYVHFGYAGTACLDAATGEVLWSRRDLRCEHLEGPGSSPLLHGELLFVHLDGADVQFVVALDKKTGETRWRRERDVPLDELVPDMRKAFATPIVVPVGERELLVSSGARATFAYDVRDGAERWRVRHDGFSMSSRPLFAHGLVFINTGFMQPKLLAVRPDGEGDVTDSHVAWSTRKSVPTMPSPLIVGEHLYLVDDGGVASCLDAKSGELAWRERVGGRTCASPLFAAGRIYFFDRDGRTTVVAPGPEHRELAANDLDEGLMASAAVAGDALLLRTEQHLYRIEEPAPER